MAHKLETVVVKDKFGVYPQGCTKTIPCGMEFVANVWVATADEYDVDCPTKLLVSIGQEVEPYHSGAINVIKVKDQKTRDIYWINDNLYNYIEKCNCCSDSPLELGSIALVAKAVTKGFLDDNGFPTDVPYLPVGAADDGTNVVFPNIQRGYNFEVTNNNTFDLNNLDIQLSGDAAIIVNSWAKKISGAGTIVSWNNLTKKLVVNLPAGASLEYSIRGEVTTMGGSCRIGNNSDVVPGIEQPITTPSLMNGRSYKGIVLNLKSTSSIGSLTATVTGTMNRNMIFNRGIGVISTHTALGIDQPMNLFGRYAISMIKLAGIYVYKASATDTTPVPCANYSNTVRQNADINNGLINNRLGTAVGFAYFNNPVTFPLSLMIGQDYSLGLDVDTWYSLTGLENNYWQDNRFIPFPPSCAYNESGYQVNDTAIHTISPYSYGGNDPHFAMYYDGSILLDV